MESSMKTNTANIEIIEGLAKTIGESPSLSWHISHAWARKANYLFTDAGDQYKRWEEMDQQPPDPQWLAEKDEIDAEVNAEWAPQVEALFEALLENNRVFCWEMVRRWLLKWDQDIIISKKFYNALLNASGFVAPE